MIDKYIATHLSVVKEARKYDFKRYLYGAINWRNRLIGIVGARGVGKTTLMLQYYLNNYSTPEDCLYISADNVNVASAGIYNLAEEYFNLGGRAILIDEIHKYPNWQQELKNIYDSFPSKQVVFSGSSTVNILRGKADLSRRVVFYNLKGLSFREFLVMRMGRSLKPASFAAILKDHVKISSAISSDISILKHFRDYLRFGYYPFFNEGIDEFHAKLNNVVEKIFYEDMPILFNIKSSTIHSLKKLFYLIATSQPFTPNISRISSQLGISKEYIYAYIDELEKAGLFTLLYPREKGFKLLRKPQKIYMDSPNLFSLVEEDRGFPVEKGSVRETFFINQASHAVKLYFSEKADFVDNKGRFFEIGGKNKETKPAGSGYARNYFVVSDNITIGFKNKIPLWLFGFLY